MANKEICIFDFKHHSILAVWLDLYDQGPKIKYSHSVPINQISDNLNLPDLFKAFLERLDKRHFPPTIVTWEEGMNFKQIALPAMPPEDFERAFWWEMKNKYSVDPENNLVGYEWVAENDLGDEKKEKILSVFYCDKKQAMERIALVQNLGFQVVHLLPGQASIAQWVSAQGSDNEKDRLVFDIGTLSARHLVVRGRKILLSRTLPLGGENLTQILTSAFINDGQKTQYAPEEAEKLKREEGVLNPQAPHIGLARPYLEKIVAEIKRSIDFYESKKFSRPISDVVFTGGGSELKGLQEFMGQFLGMKVSFLAGGKGDFTAALGAAFSDQACVNLLPSEIKNAKQENTKKISIRMAFSMSLIILVFLIGWSFVSMKIAESNLKAIESEWKETSRMNDLLLEVVKQQRFRISTLKGNVMHAGLLKDISHAIPSSIILDELEFNRQNGTLTIHGVASADKEGDVKAIAQFMGALLQTPFFSDATLVSSAQIAGGSQASKFEIRCLTKGVS